MAEAVLQPGDRIGDWVIEAPLGEGGMGAVYRVHAGLSERVKAALKVLKTASDAETRARFVREAEALGTVNHPAIVRVMGFGEDPAHGVRYLAMELVTGENLKSRLQRGPLSLFDALAAFAPLASALEHAHAAGIFHRDVKPANIVLCADGTTKLVDFGIAAAPEWETLTLSGHIGTFAYLPPEVFRGERPLPGALDVYALGQCVHEALTGQRPFAVEPGLTPAAVAATVGAKKIQHGPLDIGDAYPQALREEIWKATDPNPAKRTTIRALREILEPLRELVVGPAAGVELPPPPGGGSGGSSGGGGGERGGEHTERVPDPPKQAYSERPRQQWVQRSFFRGRRKSERILIGAAVAALLLALVLILMPREPAAGGTSPAEREGPKSGGEPARLPSRTVGFERGSWMAEA